jgi:hypothetical protein
LPRWKRGSRVGSIDDRERWGEGRGEREDLSGCAWNGVL